MSHYLLWAGIFLAGYLLNMFYITVFYHRGLTHSALKLGPGIRRWIAWSGIWVTGLDPKAWVCMHRLHHLHSDTAEDPHSPWNAGVFGVLYAQLVSYEKTIVGLFKNQEPYVSTVKDLNFPVSWIIRKKLWWVPYTVTLGLAVVLGFVFQSLGIGIAYYLGMMSHPIQGWLVNALAHRYGYRNFDTPDQSKNNSLVAWFVFGEGYQNNHHATPESAKFSKRWFEVDFGYVMCVFARIFGLVKFN